MITSRDVHKEVEIAEKGAEGLPQGVKIVVKLLTVIIKILLAVRTNTVLIARKTGAKLIEPKKREEVKKEITTANLDNPVIKNGDNLTIDGGVNSTDSDNTSKKE